MATAHGFIALADVFDAQVTEIGVELIDQAIQETTEQHNLEVNAMLSLWNETTTDVKKRYEIADSATMQPMDEMGHPLPRKYNAYYETGIPIRDVADAWGDTRKSRHFMSVRDVNNRMLSTMRADKDWLKRHMLATLFTDTAYNYTDENFGVVSVTPLANGDTVTYILDGIATAQTDDHYLAQAAAIDDANNPFEDIYDELVEHPANNVSEASPIVVYVPTNLKASIRALADFVPAPALFVAPGTSADHLEDDLIRFTAFGSRVLGVVNDCVIVEWKSLPSSYMIAIATGAEQFMFQREYDPAPLKGLYREEIVIAQGNLHQHNFIRHTGFAIKNRTAAVAYRIGDAAYAIPTGYAQILAV